MIEIKEAFMTRRRLFSLGIVLLGIGTARSWLPSRP